MSRARSHYRHYREIHISDLPKMYDHVERPATDEELEAMDINSKHQKFPDDIMQRYGYEYRKADLQEKRGMGITRPEKVEREATLQELADKDIHVLKDEDGRYIRRGDQVWALVCAYMNRNTKEAEMADGSPCPGVEIIGRPGMYGKQRARILDEILEFEPEEKAKIKDLHTRRHRIMGDEE